MEEITPSRIDAMLQATKQLFNHLHADGGGQQIRRATIVENHRRPCEPILGLCLIAEDIRSLCQDLGEFPCAPALFLTEARPRNVCSSLDRPQADAYGAANVVGLQPCNSTAPNAIPIDFWENGSLTAKS
jgi:hypothetical protein